MLPRVVEDERRRSMMFDRYAEIEALAIIAGASNHDVRILDNIGALHGGKEDRLTAVTLAVFQFESAKGIRGNTGACKTILELPEQLIRLWGFWKHGINYYSAPVVDSKLWAIVTGIWPAGPGKVNRPIEGKRFHSVTLFCYYLYACESANIDSGTWLTPEDLKNELRIIDLRNNIAHSTVYMSACTRATFFSFAETWLHRLTKDCLGSTSYEAMLSVVAPLDIL